MTTMMMMTMTTKMMDRAELQRQIRRDPNMHAVTRGVFARDELPRTRLLPGAYVLNTHPAPGVHWMLIYVDENGGKVELYDSLGYAPKHYGLDSLIDRSLPERLQSEDTLSCGLYVLYFLYWRSRGIHMDMLFRSLLKDGEHTVRNHYLCLNGNF